MSLKKQFLSAVFVHSAAVLPLLAQATATNMPPPPDPPPATQMAAAMLASCVATLPREPLELVGSLTVRKQRGIIVAEHPYRLRLDWGATPQFVQCALLNAQGQTQQCLTIIRRDGVPELELRSGPALEKQPLPSLSARVLDTDISWLDLSLDFLWWKNVQWEGEGAVLNRTCDILLARPPSPIPGCAGVRIWLHRETGFLMRAEQLDPHDQPLRRMSVGGVEKFKDRWFVNPLDVVAEKSDFRTRLLVKDVLTP
ncbi:MAG: outer membrane lipoprotein-sorting protein [Kiritimatiellia bacterium]